MQYNDKTIEELLEEENKQLLKLKTIVTDTISEEKLIFENLLNPPTELLTRGQKVSDRIARFGGSWKFIILFAFVLTIWILYNTIISGKEAFDPYPFILMNLVLSCIAALQAPIIMMSQNRQEEKDRQRSQNDYLINLKAELEIRSLHQKMDLLLEEQIRSIHEIQLQILKEVKENKPKT